MSNFKQLPADGLVGLKQNFSKDALSGFLVFLLALPLSLGIAKASEFPAIFGLVSAIIGGVVVSFFAGSRLTIKGPAAGLIAICGGAIAVFGGGDTGWHLALGAIVVAGVIQLLFGILKLGKVADFFPSAAIHGMLAAIGIIIMSKQIHVLLGIDPATLKGKEPLELLAMIPHSIVCENPHLTEIGIACLLLLIGLSYVKNQQLKKIPAPLVVLIIAIPLGIFLHVKTEGAIANFALVKIGSIVDAFTNGTVMKGDFISRGVINADFGALQSHFGEFAMYVILFALIGSLESLLTAKAIDNIDPYNRKSDFNKDLIAVGIGNTLSGLIGGLPMISEVARSSANVSNGGVTRWANFFHGLFLLIALLIAVPIIEMIPNAALAAMLIYVGIKLAHPRKFIHMWHTGKEQFLIFTVTIIVTLTTDLLVGVGTGILLKFIINMVLGASFSNLFKIKIAVKTEGNNYNLIVQSELLFSNILAFKAAFAKVPAGQHLIVDVSNAKVVDHTSIVTLNALVDDYKEAGGTAKVIGFENHRQLSHAPTSTRVHK
jgi:MFS superfamily sulfate permease-like transporter